jgi:hypothetical protein
MLVMSLALDGSSNGFGSAERRFGGTEMIGSFGCG